tara:strand:- start:717 stop:4268 length:3552 start_codon:yes stop_codon:yes gene_type:complete
MLEKNKQSLSHLAFLQEERKKFKEGVPLASHPYLVSEGVDPIEFSMQVEEINRRQAEDAAIAQLPPEQQQKMLMLRQFMEQAQAQDQQQDQQMGMEPPQGQPMQQQMQPPQGMAQQQMAPQGMVRYGGEPCHGWGKVRGHRSLPKAQEGNIGQGGVPVKKKKPAREMWEITEILRSMQDDLEEIDWLEQNVMEDPDDIQQKERDLKRFKYSLDLAAKKILLIEEELGIPGGSSVQNMIEDISNGIDAHYVRQNVLKREREFNNNLNQPKSSAPNDDYNDWVLGFMNTPEWQALQEEVAISGHGPEWLPQQLKSIYSTIQQDRVAAEDVARASMAQEERDVNNINFPIPKPDFADYTGQEIAPFQPDYEAMYEEEEFPDELPYRPAPAREPLDISDDAYLSNRDRRISKNVAEKKRRDRDKVYDKLGPTYPDEELLDIKAPASDQLRKENLSISKEEESTLLREDYEKAVREKIGNSIEFELTKGGEDGKPLSYSAWTKGAIDAGYEVDENGNEIPIDSPELRKQAEDYVYTEFYLPLEKEIGVGQFPLDLVGGLTDFHLNSEDPRASLMVAAGIITDKEKLALYTGGHLDEAKVQALWDKKGNDVRKVLNNEGFSAKYDNERKRSYKNSKFAGKTASEKTAAAWQQRVDINLSDYDADNYIPDEEVTTVTTQPVSADDGTPNVSPITETKDTDPDWLKEYKRYEKYSKNPQNEKSRDALYQAYKTRAESTGLVPKSRKEFDELWLKDIKQKLWLKGKYSKEELDSDEWDTNKKNGRWVGKNWKYNEMIAGMPDNAALTEEEIKHSQAIFQAGVVAKQQNPELFENSTFPHVGPTQATNWGLTGADPGSNISGIEGFAGNNFIQQMETLGIEEEPAAVTTEEPEAVVEEQLDINVPALGRTAELPDAEFWLQDMIGMGTAISNKFRINKYYPWAPTLDKPTMEPVFDDPTRRIAAISEQKTISDQARAMYSGPQSLAAFTGKTSGQAMKGIADTVDRVNRYNVDTANKFAMINANVDLQTQQLNNATRTKLYDDTMLVEQNYDNAMMQADTEIAKQIQNAFTNRANTYNMNTLYDQYNVRPGTGGVIEFTNPRNPWPTDPRGKVDNRQQMYDFVDNWIDKYGKDYPIPGGAWKNMSENTSSFYGRPSATAMMNQGYTGTQAPYNAGYQGGYGYDPYNPLINLYQ